MYCTVRVIVIYTVVQYRKISHKKGKSTEKRNIKYIRTESPPVLEIQNSFDLTYLLSIAILIINSSRNRETLL